MPPELQAEYVRLNEANNNVMAEMLAVGVAFIQASGFIRYFQYGAAVQVLAQGGQTDQAKLVRDFGEKISPELAAFSEKLEGHIDADTVNNRLKDEVNALLDGVTSG
jgi:hypothetical protein